jgi:hypothetical protein
MGGYMISYEAFQTYVEKQAIMAKSEREKADKDVNYTTRAASYIGSAEGREAAVFELAKYLGAPEAEVKRIWEDAEK